MLAKFYSALLLRLDEYLLGFRLLRSLTVYAYCRSERFFLNCTNSEPPFFCSIAPFFLILHKKPDEMKTNSLFLSFLSGLFLLFAAPVSGLAQELTCGVLIKPELDTSQLATWMLPFQDRFGNRYRPSDLILPALGGDPKNFRTVGVPTLE